MALTTCMMIDARDSVSMQDCSLSVELFEKGRWQSASAREVWTSSFESVVSLAGGALRVAATNADHQGFRTFALRGLARDHDRRIVRAENGQWRELGTVEPVAAP